MAAQDRSGWQTAESPNEYDDDGDDAVFIDKPKEGESVAGVLLERTEEAGQYNSPLYKLRRTDDYERQTNRDGKTAGPVVLMFSNKSIDKRFTHNSLTAGDEVLIEGVGTYTETFDGEEQECTEYNVEYK